MKKNHQPWFKKDYDETKKKQAVSEVFLPELRRRGVVFQL